MKYSTFVQKTFIQKAEQRVMEEGPLKIERIVRLTGYQGKSPGRILHRSRNLYYMGTKRTGVWYLEHQVQDARDNCQMLQDQIKLRREKQRYEEFYLPPNTHIHSFLTLFGTNDDRYTVRQFWKIVGGNLIEVGSHLKKLAKGGVLIREGRPAIYRRNPKVADICGDAAEEIFGKRFEHE